MNYTIGLDFGTHQTKVCIEDASNPAQKIYEFFEFEDLDGNKSVLFPSIVQINNDDTLSYGFVDDSGYKTVSNWKDKLLYFKNKIFNKQTEYNKQLKKKKHIFRYFKLATFSNQQWQYGIKPEIISVWYLTFVLFKLQKKYGNNFFTQMGVPYSINAQDTEKQKSTAYKILISANLLVSKYVNIDNFLKIKYTELWQNTELPDYSEQDIIDFGINVMPEAFAGLSSITQQGKLAKGMHLLIDIGGGTTDIAFFTITDNLPNIHAVMSFPQGLNYIFEEYLQANNLFSMSEVQQLFRNNQEDFEDSVSFYHRLLKDNTNKMIQRVEQEFLNKKAVHGWSISKFRGALQDKHIVYCGGGSMYNSMRIALSNFTDIRLINKELLNIPYIKNKNIDVSLFTILATSYGLSIQLENEITMIPIEKFFDNLPQKNEEKYDWRKEYGLVDT